MTSIDNGPFRAHQYIERAEQLVTITREDGSIEPWRCNAATVLILLARELREGGYR